MNNINIIMTNMNQMMNSMNLLNKLINDFGTYQINNNNNNIININNPFNFNNQINEKLITIRFEIDNVKKSYNIECRLNDKLSYVINKFKRISGKTSEMKFIFNNMELNPNLTVEKANLFNLSKIIVLEMQNILGGYFDNVDIIESIVIKFKFINTGKY